MTTELAAPKSRSLADIAADLEAVCTAIDSENGEISEALIERFKFAELALRDKVDRWIGYMDGLDGMIATLEIRSKRAAAALKTARSFEKRLKAGMKFVIEQNPNLTFKGESGTVYLHGQAETVEYEFKFGDKTVREVIDPAFIAMEPGVIPYLVPVTHQVIDETKLKIDLKQGKECKWARLVKGSHPRVKG